MCVSFNYAPGRVVTSIFISVEGLYAEIRLLEALCQAVLQGWSTHTVDVRRVAVQCVRPKSVPVEQGLFLSFAKPEFLLLAGRLSQENCLFAGFLRFSKHGKIPLYSSLLMKCQLKNIAKHSGQDNKTKHVFKLFFFLKSGNKQLNCHFGSQVLCFKKPLV